MGRLQYAEFIPLASGLTESEAVPNELDATVMYLTVISEGTPGVTVQLLTTDDTVNGDWFDSPINLLDGTVDDTISVAGLYTVPIGGVRYIRIKNESADNTLHVFGDLH